MTANSDNIKWSVVGPMIIGGVACFGWFLWVASGIAENVKSLTEDTRGIKTQLAVQASAMTHLEDEFHYGGTRMDQQDHELAEIRAQLSALKDQVAAERSSPIRRPQ